MKKRHVLHFVMVISIIFIAGTLNAQKATQEREVKGFNQIAYSLPCNLEIQQGTMEKVVLEGDQNDIDKIITEVEDGQLKIKPRDEVSGKFKEIKIIVTVKELNGIAIVGSGDINFTTPLKSSDLEIKVSGSCDLNCEKLKADNLQIRLAGSGDMYIGGDLSSELKVNLAGSGDIQTGDLKAPKADISVAGSGDVTVWATDFLFARVAGSGDIKYKGSPEVDKKVSGSGDIKKL